MFIKLTLTKMNDDTSDDTKYLYLNTMESVICHMTYDEDNTTLYVRQNASMLSFVVKESPVDILRQAKIPLPLLDDPEARIDFERENILMKDTSALNLSAHVTDVLYECGINTVDDLIECTIEDLQEMKGMGDATITRIKKYLQKYHLSLRILPTHESIPFDPYNSSMDY